MLCCRPSLVDSQKKIVKIAKFQSGEMAQQLAKRSGQLAKERNQSQLEAMAYLLGLMKQGWAAQQNTDAD